MVEPSGETKGHIIDAPFVSRTNPLPSGFTA